MRCTKPVSYLKTFWLLALLAPVVHSLDNGEESMARHLLSQALDNQYRGRYQAILELVDDSFAGGRDSLAGVAEFADDLGQRKLTLAGPQKSFEYRSLNFGKEQWVLDATNGRIRRIANRQWKKNVVGNLLTYEDMLKFPADFFLEYASCRGMKTTDSAYQITMMLRPVYQSLYTKLEVTLGKQPVLLRSITFYGSQDQKLKTMEIKGYKEAEGKWLATDMAMFDCDSLSTMKMCLRNFSFQDTPTTKEKSKSSIMSLFSRLTGAKPEAAPMEADADHGEVNN